ncbi:HPr kinase [Desulfofarcimen acetoxidans DSM 771]|uniref:HPr kinase n=1 Tax=Desulfofarcimen acetoxidans (strain ATCC 49208 / DSM 771 / KCTC 5769 / VKM B-1644 / 5575) TaxID=485916 RepID=C8W095_DESAS|nr:HPr kinase [Desulfofarcimen acetoxidans DSM 771]
MLGLRKPLFLDMEFNMECEFTMIENKDAVYSAFGICISSEIPLPELLPGAGVPDVHIIAGKVPEYIDEVIAGNEYYQAGKNQLLLHVKGVASYYIKNGSQIIVEPVQKAETCAVRLYLLGSAMGALLLQRGLLPIHGSAIAAGKYCFIITGVQGAGKSTLASAFKNKGYSILTDDIAAVAFDQAGNPLVLPAYPQQKLWKDSLALLVNNPTSYPNIWGKFNKYAISIQDNFCGIPQKLTAIYELRKENCPGVSMNRFSGMGKLSVIMNNIYRSGFIRGLNLAEESFRHSAALAQQVAVSGIIRPDGMFTIEEQIALLKRDFEEWK